MPAPAYLLAYVPALLAALGLMWGGVWSWTTPLFIFGLIPAVELALPRRLASLPDVPPETRRNSLVHAAVLWGVVPVQVGLLIALLVTAPVAASWATLAGNIVSVGIGCGMYGLNVGHELGHRGGRAARLGAWILMGTALYAHFWVEHNRGHHARVATPEDPASARLGETVQAFWLRSIAGGLRSAWGLDRRFVLAAGLVQGALLLLVASTLGPMAAGAWLGAAVVGVLLLETVNYVEHYGLQRHKDHRGRYERVAPRHSWNAENPVGRALLFDLTRHSDHHANASRPHPALRYDPLSPQLPTGYSGMILLAQVPPLFFAVMHPQLDREQQRLREAA